MQNYQTKILVRSYYTARSYVFRSTPQQLLDNLNQPGFTCGISSTASNVLIRRTWASANNFQCQTRFSGTTCQTTRTCNNVAFNQANVCSGKGL